MIGEMDEKPLRSGKVVVNGLQPEPAEVCTKVGKGLNTRSRAHVESLPMVTRKRPRDHRAES